MDKLMEINLLILKLEYLTQKIIKFNINKMINKMIVVRMKLIIVRMKHSLK